MKTCYLCEKGFPLAGDKHIPTQSLGMIPVMRCELKVKRGDIAAFRLHLNLTQRHGDLHHNGRRLSHPEPSRKRGSRWPGRLSGSGEGGNREPLGGTQ